MARAAINRSARVEATGLRELRKAMRQMGDRQLMAEFGRMNQSIADEVVKKARQRASLVGPQQRAAAKNLRPKRTATAARVELFADDRIPFAMGAEFGADRNEDRRIPNRTRRVREKQYAVQLVDSTHYGKQVRRRVRIEDKVIETTIAARTMKGWNQFRPWAGNAFTTNGQGGYFLFPTIRAERENIIERYIESLEAFVDKNIPDGPKLMR